MQDEEKRVKGERKDSQMNEGEMKSGSGKDQWSETGKKK